MTSTSPEPEQISAALLREWTLPGAGGSKRTRGQVAVLGGSCSTPGAVMLAGLAALRVGAGVLSLAVAAPVAGAVAAAVPEASVAGLALFDAGRDPAVAPLVGKADVVLVGPGLDAPDPAAQLVLDVLHAADDDTTFVVDAFALGVLPGIDAAPLRGRGVLTPNSTEAAHLLEVEEVGDDDAAVARRITERFGCVVGYSGHVTAPDGRAWVVPTGHAGLGTSGSGDVLAGAVAGLLARGADPAQAACWATFLHASAGDRLAAQVGRLGFLARELVDRLPFVLVELEA